MIRSEVPKREVSSSKDEPEAKSAITSGADQAVHPRPTGFYIAHNAKPGSSEVDVSSYLVPTAPRGSAQPSHPPPKTRHVRQQAYMLFDENSVPVNSLEVDEAHAGPSSPSAGSQYSLESGESPTRIRARCTPAAGVSALRPQYSFGHRRGMSLEQGDRLIRAPSYRQTPKQTTCSGRYAASRIRISNLASNKPFVEFISHGEISGTGYHENHEIT